ncbi:MAG TPA: DUF1684 domain-containing protein [Bacteroidota bacterium]|nr:DUF1684 domain-containing protein [Bacteroidota bacterium]
MNSNRLPIAMLIVAAAAVLAVVSIIARNRIRETEAYKSEIEEWHAKRIQRLERPQGWLSLVALDWLKEGKNEFPSIGAVTLKKGRVFVVIDKGLVASLEGKSFLSGIVRTDTDEIVIGSRVFTIIRRNDRFAVRMWDSESPTRRNFAGIERYPVDRRWRIEARWEAYDPPKKVGIATVIPGMVEDDLVPGAAVFTVDGAEMKLEPTLEEGETDYFFVFGDETNGKETYDAGRFLYAHPPKDGRIILDFNEAYNPPCAFTDFATCPLPTPGNRLKIAVEAGEKKYLPH